MIDQEQLDRVVGALRGQEYSACELVRFADCRRFLMVDGLVAPEQIERLFRQVDVGPAAELGPHQRGDGAHSTTLNQHAFDAAQAVSAAS